jgi:hypothetical protein
MRWIILQNFFSFRRLSLHFLFFAAQNAIARLYGSLFLIFWGIFVLISIVSGLIYIATYSLWDLIFSHILICICYCCFLDGSHFHWNEMGSQRSFDLHFSHGLGCWTVFLYLLSIYSFEKHLFSSLAHSSDWNIFFCSNHSFSSWTWKFFSYVLFNFFH